MTFLLVPAIALIIVLWVGRSEPRPLWPLFIIAALVLVFVVIAARDSARSEWEREQCDLAGGAYFDSEGQCLIDGRLVG